jgi:hypothetical protein
MTRLTRAWGALEPEQRLAAVAAFALLVTMFLPWYDLQSLNRKTGAIDSQSISAFGDVSFVEAAVFLVAAGVIALMFARAEHRDFHMPGSDGAVVKAAGCWAALLIFYRVFSRPAGHGYPVGIQWGFFLAFVAAGALGFAGWRMRATSVPEAPLMRKRSDGRDRRPPHEGPPADQQATVNLSPRPPADQQATTNLRQGPPADQDVTAITPQRPPVDQEATGNLPQRPPVESAAPPATRKRPRLPPPPPDQLSFEDPPPERDQH